MRKYVYLILLSVLLSCDEPTTNKGSIKKPESVPEGAVWSGGPDGGSWFLCESSKEKINYYHCEIYNDYDGAVWAKGDYVLHEVQWNDHTNEPIFTIVKSSKQHIDYNFFDGKIIHLTNQQVLLPDGIIDYPFDSKSGKTQKYKLGEPIGEEIQYEKE